MKLQIRIVIQMDETPANQAIAKNITEYLKTRHEIEGTCIIKRENVQILDAKLTKDGVLK